MAKKEQHDDTKCAGTSEHKRKVCIGLLHDQHYEQFSEITKDVARPHRIARLWAWQVQYNAMLITYCQGSGWGIICGRKLGDYTGHDKYGCHNDFGESCLLTERNCVSG